MHPNSQAREAFARWEQGVRASFYLDDTHLQSLLRYYGREASMGALSAFGMTSASLDPLIRLNNRDEHLPRLMRYDGQGRRVEAIDFHPSYHEIGRKAYASGLMERYGQVGREFETLSLLYLFAHHGEAGHSCPMACTAGLIKILQADDPERHRVWLERLTDPNYDSHFHGAQFLTEVQGGSDVGANAVVAHRDEAGQWRLTGEKWFCSVIDAHLFLVTARPEGEQSGTRGLRAFVVPRTLQNGETNHFNIRRLKFKMGTRSMASAEVDFVGALATPVGDFRRTVEIVLNTSRLYNAVCSIGMMQRAFLEAYHYAHNRMAFGQPIVRFPTVARIVARLRTEAYANRATTFLLAHLFDRKAKGELPDREQMALRMLVNLNKFWTSVEGTTSARDAIEILGGNGAIEEFSVLPRLLRDSIVCEAWEGGHNVLCAQTLKDAQKIGVHQAAFAFLEELASGDARVLKRLAAERARWDTVVALPAAQASVHIRDICESLRPVAQAAALVAETQMEGHDPLIPVVVDHLLTCSEQGWDALSDGELQQRVVALAQ